MRRLRRASSRRRRGLIYEAHSSRRDSALVAAADCYPVPAPVWGHHVLQLKAACTHMPLSGRLSSV